MDETGEVKGFYGLVLDLTEKKEAEKKQKELKEKLNDAQKMQAIGTLAGGLAHDFNNLMMGMLGRASLMLAQMDPSDPMAEHVRSIEEYVGSAVHLTQQLLGFARGGKYEVQPTAINELLDNSALLFARTNKNIRIHGDYHENNPIVQIDRKQIEQVLLNMFVNAKQAMEEGGNIYLETNIVFLDDIFCKPYEISSGSYIRIIISDDGCGMTEIVRRQVFDPFFTTKEKQRGTGLGLASAYGIIKNHNGIITVYSEQGSGSSFHIYLPHSKQSSALDKKRENKPEIIEGFENILLVDDENLILEVGQALLKSLGYTVMLAQSGQQALDILNDKKGEIDLVILDLVMPEMNGAETFKKIRKQYPNIRVLLSSGYSINGQAQQVMDQGCDGFIQKPFSLAELSQVTKNVLIR